MAQVDSLKLLFVDTIKDLYSAETQITKALPKMAKAATSPDLKRGFEEHLEQTRMQTERLKQISDQLGFKVTGKKCAGMEGIIQEGDEVLKESYPDQVRDAGLIEAAQKVEHYEIAGYGSARTFARFLGYDDAVRLLQQTLDEESATDKKLTQIAESHINREAIKMDR
jgi:ferritin-like metal-binding protein YciE